MRKEFTVYSQVPNAGRVLIVGGVGSHNLINGWFLINKVSENSSISKQVFCLYTPESCL